MTRKLAIILCLLALGACSRQNKPAPPTTTTPAAVAPGLKVVANDPALLAGPTETSFKIPAIRTLLVRLSLPEAPSGVVWTTLTMTTPQGAVFLTRHVPFSTDTTMKQVASPQALGQMVDVKPVRPIPGGVALDSYFLVGGTALPNQGEPGMWTINMAVDGRADLAGQQIVDFVMSL